MSTIVLMQILFLGSYVIAFFWLCSLVRVLVRGRRWIFLVSWTLFTLFFRARFWEPQQIQVEYTTIDIWVNKRVVLIADLHLGVYKDRVYLQKVVNKINRIPQVDMVLIAGDLTNHPTASQPLEELFQPLWDLNVPVYTVLWNHDTQAPGPDLRLPLVQALEKYGVEFLHNDIVQFDDFFLVWLGPYLSNEDRVSLLDNFHVVNNVVVLAHNPDTTLMYRNWNADLTLVWHTHCGQVRIPFIHEMLRPIIYPVTWDFDCWLSREKYTQLFITPWLGEVVLPIRFRAKPTIHVLDLSGH